MTVSFFFPGDSESRTLETSPGFPVDFRRFILGIRQWSNGPVSELERLVEFESRQAFECSENIKVALQCRSGPHWHLYRVGKVSIACIFDNLSVRQKRLTDWIRSFHPHSRQSCGYWTSKWVMIPPVGAGMASGGFSPQFKNFPAQTLFQVALFPHVLLMSKAVKIRGWEHS